VLECCEAGRLSATTTTGTCSSRDQSRDLSAGDDGGGRQSRRDDVDRSCAVMRDVCCLAERRQMRCRRGVSHALTETATQLQRQQLVDGRHCQRLSDDAKVPHNDATAAS